MAKPYSASDSVRERSFERISEFCKVLQSVEEIVDLVYECYDEEQQHAELIVRIPHLLGYYYNNSEKSAEIKINFSELYRFYKIKCMPEMYQKLKKIEKIPIAKQETAEHHRQFLLCPFKKCLQTVFWISMAILIVITLIYCLISVAGAKKFYLECDNREKNFTIGLTFDAICDQNVDLICPQIENRCRKYSYLMY
jgi:hypothetical protein